MAIPSQDLRRQLLDFTKCDDLQFEKIVLESRSIRECLIKMNLSPYGGNYRVFKKKVKELGLNTDHFLGQGWNKNNSPADIKDISVYFNNKIPITSYKLKRRILKDGIKPNRCESCGLNTWMGKPIPLELHHINCNNQDNRLENLLLLCPNCHAMTDGYRNRK